MKKKSIYICTGISWLCFKMQKLFWGAVIDWGILILHEINSNTFRTPRLRVCQNKIESYLLPNHSIINSVTSVFGNQIFKTLIGSFKFCSYRCLVLFKLIVGTQYFSRFRYLIRNVREICISIWNCDSSF